jgi:hypothetical protein
LVERVLTAASQFGSACEHFERPTATPWRRGSAQPLACALILLMARARVVAIDRKLCRIRPVAASNRRVYRLSPTGPEGLLGAMGRLAGNGRTLAGSLSDDRIQIWLAQDDRELVLTMWPGEYRACLDPLLVLDE